MPCTAILPLQVNGMTSFHLKKAYDKLITLDAEYSQLISSKEEMSITLADEDNGQPLTGHRYHSHPR
jgi:hypothetical protein